MPHGAFVVWHRLVPSIGHRLQGVGKAGWIQDSVTGGARRLTRFGEAGRPPADGLAAMLCVNVLHIAPWPVTGALMRGAGRHLGDGDCLFVYGPFKRGGIHTAGSNESFDRSLRDRNPEWGVRDVGDVAAEATAAGLALADTVAMPANNLVLVFRRLP